jgi:hypothetical protein
LTQALKKKGSGPHSYLSYPVVGKVNLNSKYVYKGPKVMLMCVPVTMAWGLLGLRVEETASRYGGKLGIF